MANALKRYPRFIHPRREARNGHIPQATFKGRLLHAQSHVLAYRRKHIFSWGDWDNVQGGDSGTDARFRARCHTGYGKDVKICFLIGMGLHDTTIGAPSDPAASVTVTLSGGAALPTETVHHGQGAGTPTDSPDEVAWYTVKVACSANSTYEILVDSIDYGRILSICCYEEASPIIDSSVDFYPAETTTSVGFPIFDSHRQRHLEGLSKMWKRNSAHLYTYPGPATGVLAATTTFTNLFDATTAVAASSAKIYLYGPDAMCRHSDGEVLDVVLAVYAQSTGGNTGEVRLQDSAGTLCSITGVTTSLTWHTTTTTISALDERGEVDVQYRNSTAGHQINIHAVSLYCYLA